MHGYNITTRLQFYVKQQDFVLELSQLHLYTWPVVLPCLSLKWCACYCAWIPVVSSWCVCVVGLLHATHSVDYQQFFHPH